jgi:hypothetical protein
MPVRPAPLPEPLAAVPEVAAGAAVGLWVAVPVAAGEVTVISMVRDEKTSEGSTAVCAAAV